MFTYMQKLEIQIILNGKILLKNERQTVPLMNFKKFYSVKKSQEFAKKTALAICNQWNSVAEMMQEYFHERNLNQNLTGHDWLYSKQIPHITNTAVKALCHRLGLTS